jgi:hypothetical protein
LNVNIHGALDPLITFVPSTRVEKNALDFIGKLSPQKEVGHKNNEINT